MPILRIQEQDGKWVEIPAIIGPRGPKGEKGDTGLQGEVGPQGPKGDTPIKGVDYTDGKDGKDGKDGASLSHEWVGSTLKITSSSGTSSSVDLTGPQGPEGPAGPQGPGGVQGIQGVQGFQGDIGYYIKAVVSRDFTDVQWDEFGEIGHEEGWYYTDNTGFRVGDLFIVAGLSTDTGMGHMLVYSYTEKYTDAGTNTSSGLKGKCIGHSIIAAKGEKGEPGDIGPIGPQGTSVTIVGSEESSLGGEYSSVTFSVGDETVTLSARNGLDGVGAKAGSQHGAEILNDGNNVSSGYWSLAVGQGTEATDQTSYAEGSGTRSYGFGSHAEGSATQADGAGSHAEGWGTHAYNQGSHAEGNSTHAEGRSSHAEGTNTYAKGESSHAEGYNTYSTGQSSHAEGMSTYAEGLKSHAEGSSTYSIGEASHAEGESTNAVGTASHAEGDGTNSDINITYKTAGVCSLQVRDPLVKVGQIIVFNSNFYTITGTETLSDGAQQIYVEPNFAEADFSRAPARVCNSGAFGAFSHSEGQNSRAIGLYSHSEGSETSAKGNYAHSEGKGTNASGNGSHAEGLESMASGINSHAEGEGAKAYGEASHAEGYKTEVKNSINNKGAHAEGYETVAVSSGSHAEGVGSYARGTGSHAEGTYTLAYGYSSHAEGGINEQTDKFKFSIIANGTTGTLFTRQELQPGNVVIDKTTTPPRFVEIVSLEGYEDDELHYLVVSPFGNYYNIQSADETEGALSHCGYGSYSHVEGHGTNALGEGSHAEGKTTIAVGSYSHVEGLGTKATTAYQHVQGKYNLESEHIHVIGGGTAYARANAHTVSEFGTGWFASNVTSSGSDYAEYFEWFDGNPNNEDRVGTIVALNCDKIYPANAEDDILGIVSGTATVIGDNPECDWHSRFLVDNYGRKIMEEIKETKPIYNPETGQTEEVITTRQFPKINPEYDKTKKYIRRSDRPEWDIVGLMGKLHVNDDGTCVPNGYAKCGGNGIATASTEKTNMRVMKRITDNIILVFMK